MESGDLNRRIRLLRYIEGATNRLGEPTEAWRDAEWAWSGKTDANDATRLKAREVGSVLTCWFKVRASSVTRSLTTLDRVRFKGAEFKIEGLKEIDDGRYLELTAVALDAPPS